MLENPGFWVAVSFGMFVLLSYKKVAGLLVRALDERSARIQSELNEAYRLRTEAQAVLQTYKTKQAEYLKEAEAILADAARDAQRLRVFSQNECKASLDARMKQAMDRIAQEETRAVAEVRNHVVDIALSTARALVIEQAEKMSSDELITLALRDIERTVH